MVVKVKLQVAEFIELNNGVKETFRIINDELTEFELVNCIEFFYYANKLVNKFQYQKTNGATVKTFSLDYNHLTAISALFFNFNLTFSPYQLALFDTIQRAATPQINRFTSGFKALPKN